MQGINNGGHWFNFRSANSNLWSMGAQPGLMGWYNRTDSTYKMVITDGGNLILGTSSASLHSGNNGLIIFGGSSGSGRSIMELHESSGVGGKAVFQIVGGTTYIGNLAKGSGSGDLLLLVNGIAGSADIAMTIKANGNTLIGTQTDTGDKLRVDGNTFTNTITTYRPGVNVIKSDAWKLGRASIGTQPTETHQITVEIGGALYTIGAAQI
jgi:hypothetical protein